MNPGNTWRKVEDLFAEALALPEPQREAFVAERCGPDTAAREELLRLLSARSAMGDFLESAALDFRGQMFGPYRAIAEVGRGGMSVVYRAERADGDFDRQVAVKIVLSHSVSAPETRILASLEHPHVARLIDAGATSLGFRYLVMEFVEGVPCTQFTAASSETEKLNLFLQVCAGVQAAHQALIVHRDLKPDNILVTASGTVKLLDFGIAKMLAPTGTQTVGLRAYTADYASPEQILGYPASTANDIYSLGVLLCEWLGGRVPRNLTGLPMDEMVRAVQEEVPPSLPLQGDLALIAHKALRREPAERYESAGALARDIERYLASEPVDARPPSWRYRAGKFIKRHRYAVAAAVLVVTALAGTAAYALRQASLAELRFNQVRSLARSVMFDLHDVVRPLTGSLPARQLIVNRSLQYLDALARDSSAPDEVLVEAARGYLRLSELQGNDNDSASVGESADGLRRAQQAVALARQVLVRSPRNVEARRTLADSLTASAGATMILGQAQQALPLAQEALAVAKKLLTEMPDRVAAKKTAAQAYVSLGQVHAELMQWPQSLPLTAEAVRLCREAAAAEPSNEETQYQLAQVLNYISGNYFRARQFDNAQQHNRLAIAISKRLYEANPTKYRALYSGDIGTAAGIEGRLKRHDRAIEFYREQLRLRREMEADNPQDMVAVLRVGTTLDRLCLHSRYARRYPEAIAAGEEAVAKFRVLRARDAKSANIATEFYFSLLDLSQAYEAMKQMNRACPMAREAVAVLEGPIRKSELSYSKSSEGARELLRHCP